MLNEISKVREKGSNGQQQHIAYMAQRMTFLLAFHG